VLFCGYCLLFIFHVPEALAHATPMVYEPAASAILDQTPPRVRIQFSERIEPKASSITIFAPDGSRADAGAGAVDPADDRAFTVSLRDGGEGSYTVSWQVVSRDDGHFTKGGYAFGVGKATEFAAANQTRVEVVHSSTASQAAAVATELFGQSVFIGVLAAITLLWRNARQPWSRPQHAAFQRACMLLIAAGTVLIVAGVAAFLTLKTLDLQRSRLTTFQESFAVFLATVDGRFALHRALFGILFGAVFFAARRRIFPSTRISKPEIGLFVLACLMILSRARVSHAAASHIMPHFSILVNAVHLLSKELWIGMLTALTFAFVPVLVKAGRTSAVAHTLSLSSKYFSLALGVAGITGAYIVWLHLKSAAYLLTTEWGTRFLILAGFAFALAVIRVYNQLVVDKALAADCITPQKGIRRDAARSWQYSIPVEMCLGIAVVFMTGQLVITTPPYPADRFSFAKQAVSQGARIDLSVHPVEQQRFLIQVMDEKTGTGVAVTETVVTLQNPGKNLGPLVAETEHRFEGGFTFGRDALSIPGVWTVDITARRTEAYDAVASFTLDYPAEIEASRIGASERPVGSFEAILGVMGLASICLAAAMYRAASNLQAQTADIESRRGLSASGFTLIKPLAAGAAACAVVSLAVWTLHHSLFRSEFQKLCERNNGAWVQAAPMREGAVLSSQTMTGCTVGAGQHFVDAREYAYSLIKPASRETHEHHH
jgi:copper transport protein